MREFIYWRVRRPAHRLFLSFIWKLPRKVIYWAVIRAAVMTEPDLNPSSVTAEQMLQKLEVA
jgi:hypothetical protein